VFADQQFNAGGSVPIGSGPLTVGPSTGFAPPQFQVVPHPPVHGGTSPGSTHGTPHKRTAAGRSARIE
jgi:hypothetical protein